MNHQKTLVTFAKKFSVIALLSTTLWSSVTLADPGGLSGEVITLGQSTALSGPLGDLGQEALKGAKVYFDALNTRGGVNGRTIKLVSKDDAYDVKKTLENVNAFITEDATFALFGTVGTPNNEALIPVAQKADLPVLMPYSGSTSLRSKSLKNVFNLRASYADEVERIVEHMSTLGTKKIAVAYQNNAFGKDVLAMTLESMERRKLKPLLTVSVENNASDAVSATEKILASNPEAILLGLAGKPTIEVIKNTAQRRRGMQMYALSVLATPSNLRAMGTDGTGVAITQVVPFPSNSIIPLVREYQQAMTAAGHTEFSHQSLEGYLNAKVVTEALRRAGRTLTRAALVAAMDGLRGYNAGGLEVSFGQGAASGSRFIELTMVNGQGKLIK